LLDRNGISGRVGQTTLADEATDDVDTGPTEDEPKRRIIEDRKIPDRWIFCLDLRLHGDAEPYVDEVIRIAEERDARKSASLGAPSDRGTDADAPKRIDEATGRRWYPVIDYSRCTNCMECIDFCLFGVYGLDRAETILVEQPDNCRKGCPACSRICPENAIIFPQHKTPAIAGATVDTSSRKIDLSALFGAPDDSAAPLDIAVRERDEQLRSADDNTGGPSFAVGDDRGGEEDEPKDELDDLIDQLDELDL
jgi:NAD-dependent dihydropyrimidine dehydrogenase PreA subunit